MRACTFSDERCRVCPQFVYKGTLCYYHTKLDKHLLTRADKVLSTVELDTLFGGRRRDDGRRLDHYTSKP